jgi:hypothetical protein
LGLEWRREAERIGVIKCIQGGIAVYECVKNITVTTPCRFAPHPRRAECV